MDREILFRGKRIDNGEWIEGDLLSKCKGSPKISINGEYNRGLFVVDSYEVIPETVSQFTGLCDENGKNVFVWDILKSNYVNFIVKPTINGWGLFRYDNGRIGRLSSMQYIHKYEVIATIFDKEQTMDREKKEGYLLQIGRLILNDAESQEVYIKGVAEVLEKLSEREQMIMWSRYAEKKTLREVALEFNVVAERIRQIEAKALRKLGHPRNRSCVMAISVKQHQDEISEYEEEKKKNGALPKVIAEKPIEELDLSVRVYNCLKRARINTVGQLQEMTKEKLLRIRNLGLKSTEEIQSKLKEYM